MKPQANSPVVDEVRARAMRISRRFGHDPRKYLKHLEAAQRAHSSRLVRQLTVVP